MILDTITTAAGKVYRTAVDGTLTDAAGRTVGVVEFKSLEVGRPLTVTTDGRTEVISEQVSAIC